MTLASFKSSCNAYVEKTPPAYLPEQLSHSTDSLSKLEIVPWALDKSSFEIRYQLSSNGCKEELDQSREHYTSRTG
jgi:hypothetical protein